MLKKLKHNSTHEAEAEIQKLRASLQIAANSLDSVKQEFSLIGSSAQLNLIVGSLEYIQEQSGIIPNKAKTPEPKTIYAKDCTFGGMGYA